MSTMEEVEDRADAMAEDTAKDANLKSAHEALVTAKCMLSAASQQTDDYHEASRLSNFGTRAAMLVGEIAAERFDKPSPGTAGVEPDDRYH